MRQYLKDLEPEEVIDRLNNGERVYYEDSRGNKYSYKVYKGMTIRYNEDGEVDGYNRSIYSTGEAYFDVEDAFKVKVNHHYRTRKGSIAYIKDVSGRWYLGTLFRNNTKVETGWLSDGSLYELKRNDEDLIEELD